MDGKLLENLDKIHTTPMGAERIRKNLSLETADVVAYCRAAAASPAAEITRCGKNWYVVYAGSRITINASSYTIITAHPEKAATH